MRSNDLINSKKTEIQAAMQKALQNNDAEGAAAAFDQMLEYVADTVRQDYEDLRNEQDSRALTARGVRQLTSEETKYYQALGEAMRAKNPRQALANLDVVMPETVIDSVFEDLETNHPLLSRIDFMPSGGAVRMIMNTNGYQEAAWGELCDEVVKELTSGFKEVNTVLFKLSAFLPVCKAMLDLGPQWLDSYVRRILLEALANGLEAALVTGDGNEKPIGMNRQAGDGVTVTGGVYPEKPAISVTDFSPATMGRLVSLMAVDPNGKPRTVSGLILLVNPQDYYQKVMPATTVMAPDGTYRNDVFPYPVSAIQVPALPRGKAVIGMAKRYFAAAGTATDGRIEYSDHAKFLEDKRLYLIKAYANGMPKDNNSFLVLDVSGLTPAAYKVTQIDATTPSADATLADLKIGALALSPAFASATVSYTAATTNASNTITATPSDAGATIEITVGDKSVDNGSAATWATGANTVTVKVTAADGTTTKTYTVTVTKS